MTECFSSSKKRGLTLGADVVIATPGRLIAHLSLGYVDLSRVSYFILDEADRMLDMGFYDDIMQIVKFLPKERQTIMFSATMPAKIQQLAQNILHNPAEVKLAVSKPAEKIVQAAYICYENQKLGIIRSLFRRADTRTCHYLRFFQVEGERGGQSPEANEAERWGNALRP